jgi:hypothetical protein
MCRQDPEIYPFPFAAVTRLAGEVPAEPEVPSVGWVGHRLLA